MQSSEKIDEANSKRHLRIELRGVVQGVGFRPFVYRIAQEAGLAGWVSNTSHGLIIEIEGPAPSLEKFTQRLFSEKPSNAIIHSHQSKEAPWEGFAGFIIQASDTQGAATAWMLPDLATCPDCLMDICDPNNRRYLYPFTNCTGCGPRFSIIRSLPYDRPNTTMSGFALCDECLAEYQDPSNRRFHAQPNACPNCGPQLAWWNWQGNRLAEKDEAVFAAAEAIREGKIVAVKGLGGFHLMVDANNQDAVLRLRKKKHREEKPFAVMVPDLFSIAGACRISNAETQLLRSPRAPIALLERIAQDRPGEGIAPAVAPNNPYLGVMLPCTPLHHILLSELGMPIVATSGNRSDEPICIDEHEALERLDGIADCYLVHNRPIARHVDDSVVRHVLGRPYILRRARGYAPLPVTIPPIDPTRASSPTLISSTMLAVGGHLKNAIALCSHDDVFISQHIGDLETQESSDAFEEVIQAFQSTYDAKPETIVCDMHPDYISTKYAHKNSNQALAVQHHHAHVLSCMADNGLDAPTLGVSWDGTGLGLDGTIWGGEFLYCRDGKFDRVAHLLPFPLPAGEKAIKDIHLCAAGLLCAVYGKEQYQKCAKRFLPDASIKNQKFVHQLLEKNIHCPLTSSMGRLFDAVAALLGIRQHASFEGQAAMELEWMIGETRTKDAYPYAIETAKSAWVIQPRPMLDELLSDIENDVANSLIASRFHNTLVSWIVDIAKRFGEKRVALSGGCFQNIYLLQRAVRRLESEGFSPYWHNQVPANDGGLCLGQIMAARRLDQQR